MPETDPIIAELRRTLLAARSKGAKAGYHYEVDGIKLQCVFAEMSQRRIGEAVKVPEGKREMAAMEVMNNMVNLTSSMLISAFFNVVPEQNRPDLVRAMLSMIVADFDRALSPDVTAIPVSTKKPN